MIKRFFESFKARLPRKLKKAAKYGIERRVYPADESEISPITLVLKHMEKVVFVIVGKCTKWKQKACLACMREERRRLIRLWESAIEYYCGVFNKKRRA